MTTAIYHSTDFDGIFCREIAKHFLGEKDIQYIGWNFGDPKVPMPAEGQVYILDLSPECLCDHEQLTDLICNRVVWIDHHKTALEKWSPTIPGSRIDGVAACRLAWQWFTRENEVEADPSAERPLPAKIDYCSRTVSEPLAVRLAGEYDVWDKRDERTDVFQYALRATPLTDGIWDELLAPDRLPNLIESMLANGRFVQYYAESTNAGLINHCSFRLKWEGLDFLCLNTPRCNSLTFAALDKPETGHDALMGFFWNGKQWMVNMFHARHRTNLDLSVIAVKYGGGGHKGAAGLISEELPFKLGN